MNSDYSKESQETTAVDAVATFTIVVGIFTIVGVVVTVASKVYDLWLSRRTANGNAPVTSLRVGVDQANNTQAKISDNLELMVQATVKEDKQISELAQCSSSGGSSEPSISLAGFISIGEDTESFTVSL